MKLERYNHIVWSILGTMALAAVVAVGVTIGVVAIRDALHNRTMARAAAAYASSDDAPAPVAGDEAPQPQPGEPGEIIPLYPKGTRVVTLIANNSPLGNTRRDWRDDESDAVTVVNFLLVDEASGKAKRLFPHDGWVPGWTWGHVEPLDGHGRSLDRMLVEYAEPDEDGEMAEDAQRALYVIEWAAGASSPQMHRVGPERAQIVGQDLDEQKGTLLLLVRVDGNGDGAIDETDPVKLWEAPLAASGGVGHAIAFDDDHAGDAKKK
jgi:hypothetical protein